MTSRKTIAVTVLAAMLCAALLISAPNLFASEEHGAQVVFDNGKIKITTQRVDGDGEAFFSADPLAKSRPRILSAYPEPGPWYASSDLVNFRVVWELRGVDGETKLIVKIKKPDKTVDKLPDNWHPTGVGRYITVMPGLSFSDPGLYKVLFILKSKDDKRGSALVTRFRKDPP